MTHCFLLPERYSSVYNRTSLTSDQNSLVSSHRPSLAIISYSVLNVSSLCALSEIKSWLCHCLGAIILTVKVPTQCVVYILCHNSTQLNSTTTRRWYTRGKKLEAYLNPRFIKYRSIFFLKISTVWLFITVVGRPFHSSITLNEKKCFCMSK